MQHIKPYILLCIMALTGCYTDVDNTTRKQETDPVPTFVNTKLSGSVTDQEGTLLNNYQLVSHLGSYQVQNTYFITQLDKADKAGHTVFVEKNGVVVSLAQIPVFENDINSLDIQATIPAATTDIATGETATLTTGLTASATSANITIRSLSTDSHSLSTAYDSEGHMLSIQSSEIWHIDIPQGAQLDLTQTGDIDLLHYDRTSGRWKAKPSLATLQESGYYAAARTTDGVIVQGKVLRDTDPVAYQWYKYADKAGRSTAKGNWIQVLPSDTEFAIEMLDPCQQNITTVSITTTAENTTNDLILDASAEYQPINATIIGCDGTLADDAIIQIVETDGTETLYLYSDPNIDAAVLVCSSEFTIAAYDIDSQETGPGIPWFTDIEDEITYLSTCSDYPDGYAYISIDGNTKVYPAFDIENTGTNIILSDVDDRVNLLIRGDDKGAYAVESVNVIMYDPSFAGGLGYAVSCENSPLGCGISDLYVSHLDETDGWVRVTFSGNIWMQTLNPLKAGTYPVEGIILSRL